MSNFVILGDMHIGARNANTVVMEHQLHYFETIFFPYLKTNNIKTILQLGDLFDTRKFSNHLILHNWKKRFFDYLEKENINFITILGNHDIFFKNVLDVNSSSLFLAEYKNINIIDIADDVNIEGVDFLIVPWICEENKKEILEKVKNTNSLYCAGHFEFSGFEINKGMLAPHGEDHKLFSKFDMVYSGHYHTKSKKDNIDYIGIPYELSWIDYEDPKGFLIFNSNDCSTGFIRNTNPLFVKIYYNDKDESDEYFKIIDCSNVKNSYVKLIVVSKTNPHQFEKFLDKLTKLSPIELRIIDELEDFSCIDITENKIEVEDTTSMIDSFIEQSETILDKTIVKDILKGLYVEALCIR